MLVNLLELTQIIIALRYFFEKIDLICGIAWATYLVITKLSTWKKKWHMATPKQKNIYFKVQTRYLFDNNFSDNNIFDTFHEPREEISQYIDIIVWVYLCNL